MWHIIFISVLLMGISRGWARMSFIKKTKAGEKATEVKDYKLPLILFIMSFAMGIVAILINRTTKAENFISGYIITEGKQTEQIESLFYHTGDRYMIDINQVDELLNLDVIATSEAYIIRSSKNQIEIIPNSQDYVVNLNKIKEDDSYLVPFKHESGIYVDTEAVFSVFGYSTSYQSNSDQTVVELFLTKTDGDPYETITLKDKVPVEVKETEKQIEEGAISQTPDINQPGNNTLPTVPYPEETKPVETEPFSEEKFLEDGGVYPDDIQEIIDNRPEETDAPITPQIVERPETTPNKMSDEEFETIWNEAKNNIAEVYKTGSPATGNVPYLERTEDFIAFNPMNKAIYYDTISVLHNPSEEGVFMEINISAEWSDMALNTDNAESAAFYKSIPAMVEATIKNAIGENEGGELYSFIKEHADKTRMGGYIATHNENGEVVSIWSDGEVGDGIMSTELNFEQWQGRETDDGLRYYTARKGEGIVIKIYKN